MDYYRILGVSRTASQAEVKAAFRKLAMEFHPDKNEGKGARETARANDHFKKLTEAYGVLSDNGKRAVYDREGRMGLRAGACAGGSDAQDFRRSRSRWSYERGSAGSQGQSAFRGGGSRVTWRWPKLTPFDYALHSSLFARVVVFGYVALDWAGDALWASRNDGKSYDDAIRRVQQAREKREEEDATKAKAN